MFICMYVYVTMSMSVGVMAINLLLLLLLSIIMCIKCADSYIILIKLPIARHSNEVTGSY